MTDDGNRWSRGGWRSPAGIGTIATVASVLVAVVALIFTNGGGGPSNVGAAAPATPSAAQQTWFFVYGSTMPGQSRYYLIEDYVAETVRASVAGRLYDTGADYPAAKFGGGQGTIEGYLLRLRPDRASEAKRTFTEIEAGLFEPVQVQTANGVSATAYEFIGPVDGMTRLDGMWTPNG
ncbi:MAG TPA: gamma-glutamylcyclotransferase family protein [Micromonosporaceae bacterium]